jgi:hypothetical protein
MTGAGDPAPPPPEEVSEEEQRPRREIVARPNATVQVRARARRAAIAADLRSSEGARRAFILQQILGRPRSRSEWDEN